MERCLHSHKHTMQIRFCFSGFFIMGLLLDMVAIFAYTQIEKADYFSIILCLLLFFTGLGLWLFGIFFYIVQTREFSIDPLGITVVYLGRYQKRYLWTEIESISVCDVDHAAKDKDVFDIVIRLVARKETQRQARKAQGLSLAGYERWRDGWYSFIRFRKIILLDYTEDRYRLIRSNSKKEIADRVTKYAKEKCQILFDKTAE